MVGISKKKYPFPGNDFGKIWMCPSVKVTDADDALFIASGGMGYFSYVMNLDLKLSRSVLNGVVGNSVPYPGMPKLSSMRKPSATVLLTEFCFSPTLENWVPAGTSQQQGVFPAARWTYFPKRHNDRGTIAFLDGHSAIFKWDYVYNKASPPPNRVEPMNPDIYWNPNREIP